MFFYFAKYEILIWNVLHHINWGLQRGNFILSRLDSHLYSGKHALLWSSTSHNI